MIPNESEFKCKLSYEFREKEKTGWSIINVLNWFKNQNFFFKFFLKRIQVGSDNFLEQMDVICITCCVKIYRK